MNLHNFTGTVVVMSFDYITVVTLQPVMNVLRTTRLARFLGKLRSNIRGNRTMKITQFIQELEKLYEEEGDIEVTLSDSQPIEYIEVLRSFITGENVVVVM